MVLQIDVFVLVTCPEACLENEKEYMQPVVTLLEVELALNPNRQWNDKLSVDFRDLLEGRGMDIVYTFNWKNLNFEVSFN